MGLGPSIVTSFLSGQSPGEGRAAARGMSQTPSAAAHHGLSSVQSGPQAAVVKWAEGGRCCQVKLPGHGGGKGGVRRPISAFTSRSQRELLKLVNSIDQRALHP